MMLDLASHELLREGGCCSCHAQCTERLDTVQLIDDLATNQTSATLVMQALSSCAQLPRLTDQLVHKLRAVEPVPAQGYGL